MSSPSNKRDWLAVSVAADRCSCTGSANVSAGGACCTAFCYPGESAQCIRSLQCSKRSIRVSYTQYLPHLSVYWQRPIPEAPLLPSKRGRQSAEAEDALIRGMPAHLGCQVGADDARQLSMPHAEARQVDHVLDERKGAPERSQLGSQLAQPCF